MGSGLIRLAVILLLVWLAVRVVRYVIERNRQTERRPRPAAIPKMLPCARCGVHVPEDQAFRLGDRVYCEDHRPPR